MMPLPSAREPVTKDETIAELLRRSGRRTGGVPLRHAFVQGGPRNAPTPGPLAGFVQDHDGRALDLYLLTVAIASHEPWRAVFAAKVWARALGLGDDESALAAISKTFRRLDERKLIERSRTGRRLSVGLMKEDGLGDSYVSPDRPEKWFRLPFAYWDPELRWYERLSLPGKAMLLVSLSLNKNFYLPYEKTEDWYGISADTSAKGLRELTAEKLLSVRRELIRAPLAPDGFTTRRYYTLDRSLGLGGETRVVAHRRIGMAPA